MTVDIYHDSYDIESHTHTYIYIFHMIYILYHVMILHHTKMYRKRFNVDLLIVVMSESE